MNNAMPLDRLIPTAEVGFMPWTRPAPLPLFDWPVWLMDAGRATLAVGECMTPLIIQWLVNLRMSNNQESLYMKGDFLASSDFVDLLWEREPKDYEKLFQKLTQQYSKSEAKAFSFSHKTISKEAIPQNYPVQRSSERLVAFQWIIVNKDISPWHQDRWNAYSYFEIKLNQERVNPSMIVLDGFSLDGEEDDLKMMLKRFKNRRISIIIVVPTRPSRELCASPIWDNFVELTPWRSCKCSKYNSMLYFHKIGNKMCDQHFHIVHPKALKREKNDSINQDQICGVDWFEKGNNYYFLKDIITVEASKRTKASEIVDIINKTPEYRNRLNRPMTVSTLARLKRELGVRTYRPEKKPRKKKVPQKKEAPQKKLQKPPQAVQPFPFDF